MCIYIFFPLNKFGGDLYDKILVLKCNTIIFKMAIYIFLNLTSFKICFFFSLITISRKFLIFDNSFDLMNYFKITWRFNVTFPKVCLVGILIRRAVESVQKQPNPTLQFIKY